MSFSLDIINYVITRKRLDAAKTKDIINRIQDVLVYIREKINKT